MKHTRFLRYSQRDCARFGAPARIVVLFFALALLNGGCSVVQEANRKALAAAHFNRAMAAYQKKDLEKARRELEQVLQFDPGHPEAKGLLADLYERAGKIEESEKYYREVLRANPNDPTAQNNLGYFLANRNRNLDEALVLIRKAVKARPDEGAFVDSLGWVYYRLGRLEQAKAELVRAKTLAPHVAEIHYHLGIVFRDLRRLDDARNEFMQALDLDPKFQPARDELRRLGIDVNSLSS